MRRWDVANVVVQRHKHRNRAQQTRNRQKQPAPDHASSSGGHHHRRQPQPQRHTEIGQRPDDTDDLRPSRGKILARQRADARKVDHLRAGTDGLPDHGHGEGVYTQNPKPTQPRAESVERGADTEARLEPVHLQKHGRGKEADEVDKHVTRAECIDPLPGDGKEGGDVVFDRRG